MATRDTAARARSPARRALAAHLEGVVALHMRDLFADDPGRAGRFSVELGDLLVDFSRHRMTGETLALLLDLAEEAGMEDAVRGLVSGAVVNLSEQRPALHTALRAPPGKAVRVDGEDVMPAVHSELDRVLEFAEKLNAGEITGAAGRPIDTVVNIGIGGSDLGPRLVAAALTDYAVSPLRLEFAANIDDRDLLRTLARCNPESTLFVVASKSFGTLETRVNAERARAWLKASGCRRASAHFAAVTARPDAARKLGVPDERIFRIWDWVGGRYSVWSAVGMVPAVALGAAGFRDFLAGAHAMDRHFAEVPLDRNIPVILGMLDIWNAEFLGAETLAVVPYDERLRLLPDYLAQLMMESNGKGVDAGGGPLVTCSGPVVWGAAGTNAQHAFFQLLHQGTHLVPVDFLVGARHRYDAEMHRSLVANCLAQGAALMSGRAGASDPQRHFPGNRPSTTLFYDDLDPATLGMLLALYEHRTFVQAVAWGINPFDQWGVEFGKELAARVAAGMASAETAEMDSSTRMLLEHFRRLAGG